MVLYPQQVDETQVQMSLRITHDYYVKNDVYVRVYNVFPNSYGGYTYGTCIIMN